MSCRVMVLAFFVMGAAIVTQGLETVALEEIVEQQANEIAELKQKAAQHEQKMTRLEKDNVRVTDENARVREENIQGCSRTDTVLLQAGAHEELPTTQVEALLAPRGPRAMDQGVIEQDGEAGKDPARQCAAGMRQCMSLANAVQLREALDASTAAKKADAATALSVPAEEKPRSTKPLGQCSDAQYLKWKSEKAAVINASFGSALYQKRLKQLDVGPTMRFTHVLGGPLKSRQALWIMPDGKRGFDASLNYLDADYLGKGTAGTTTPESSFMYPFKENGAAKLALVAFDTGLLTVTLQGKDRGVLKILTTGCSPKPLSENGCMGKTDRSKRTCKSHISDQACAKRDEHWMGSGVFTFEENSIIKAIVTAGNAQLREVHLTGKTKGKSTMISGQRGVCPSEGMCIRAAPGPLKDGKAFEATLEVANIVNVASRQKHLAPHGESGMGAPHQPGGQAHMVKVEDQGIVKAVLIPGWAGKKKVGGRVREVVVSEGELKGSVSTIDVYEQMGFEQLFLNQPDVRLNEIKTKHNDCPNGCAWTDVIGVNGAAAFRDETNATVALVSGPFTRHAHFPGSIIDATGTKRDRVYFSNYNCLYTLTLTGKEKGKFSYLTGVCDRQWKGIGASGPSGPDGPVSRHNTATEDGAPVILNNKWRTTGACGGTKCAQFDSPLIITAFEETAYVYQESKIIRKVILTGSKRGTVTTLQHKFCGLKSFQALNRGTLAVLNTDSVNLVDVSPTIKCADPQNEFLLRDLSVINVSQALRVDLFQAYSSGLEIKSDAGVWAFTGYRKASNVKKYDGGGFYFTKSLLCFQQCKPGVGERECTASDLIGKDRCCVFKITVNSTVNKDVVSDTCERRWAVEQLKLKTAGNSNTGLQRSDGMKVY